MSVTVLIPTPLRHLTNNEESVTAEGATVAEVFNDLDARYPGIKERLCDESGEISRSVSVYVNREDSMFKVGIDTVLNDGDELSIMEVIIMRVKVLIPTPLRNLTNEEESITAEGTTVAEVFDDLEAKHPGIKERLCDESGEIRRFVNVYVNQEDIRFKEGKDTALNDGDEVSIVPAIAGG